MHQTIINIKEQLTNRNNLKFEKSRIASILIEKMPEVIEYKNYKHKEVFGKNCISIGLNESAYRYENPEVFSCFLLDLLYELLNSWDNYIVTKNFKGERCFLFDHYFSENTKILGKKDNRVLFLKGMNKDILSELLLNQYTAADMRGTLQIFTFPPKYELAENKLKMDSPFDDEPYLIKSWSYGDGKVERMLFNLNYDYISQNDLIELISKITKLYHILMEVEL